MCFGVFKYFNIKYFIHDKVKAMYLPIIRLTSLKKILQTKISFSIGQMVYSKHPLTSIGSGHSSKGNELFPLFKNSRCVLLFISSITPKNKAGLMFSLIKH